MNNTIIFLFIVNLCNLIIDSFAEAADRNQNFHVFRHVVEAPRRPNRCGSQADVVRLFNVELLEIAFWRFAPGSNNNNNDNSNKQKKYWKITFITIIIKKNYLINNNWFAPGSNNNNKNKKQVIIIKKKLYTNVLYKKYIKKICKKDNNN